MLERLTRTKRNLALAALGLALVWCSWTVRTVLNPVILGYMLATILNPMVQGLERKGWGRRAAANLIFLSFFLLATGVGAVVFFQGRALIGDLRSSNFAENLDDMRREYLGDFLGLGENAPVEAVSAASASGAGEDERSDGRQDEQPDPTGDPLADIPPDAVARVAGPASSIADLSVEELEATWATILTRWATGETRAGQSAMGRVESAWPYARRFFGSLLAILTLIFLLPIYAYFLLFELDRIHAFVYRYIPVRERERFSRIGVQIGEVLASFFRGRLLICFLKGVLITAGLWIASIWVPGIKYTLFLGMGSGFLALIPFVGPLLGFGVTSLLLLADGLEPWHTLIVTGCVFGLAEVVEGYVLLPAILGDSLGLHPVVVLLSVFVGGAALGMFGFLIALPLAAALVIMVREMVLPALADFADEDARPDPSADPPPDPTAA